MAAPQTGISGFDSVMAPSPAGASCNALVSDGGLDRLRDLGPLTVQLREQPIPIDVEVRHGRDGCLTFQLGNNRTAITSRLDAIDRKDAVGWMNEPDPGNARTLIRGQFRRLIVAGGGWREHLDHPVRRTRMPRSSSLLATPCTPWITGRNGMRRVVTVCIG